MTLTMAWFDREKMPMTRYLLVLMAGISMSVVAVVMGLSQDFPSRPITLIVPFATGGGNDIIARLVAGQVAEQVGQPVVVDNRPGVNGILGTQAVATAESDGYTLLHVSSSLTINNAVYRKLPYNILTDLAPIANVCIDAGYVAVVNPKLPIHSIADLIAFTKSHKVFYGSPGAGNPTHLATELFKARAGINMKSIPFRGTAPALDAVMGGAIQFMFAPVAAVIGLVRGGQVRAIGFSGTAPARALLDVPLIKETVPGYSFSGAWYGWFAPAAASPSIVARMNREVRQAVKAPRVDDELQRVGCDPTDLTTAEFSEFLRRDTVLMLEAVRAAGIEPQ